jgi:hypothetical protein
MGFASKALVIIHGGVERSGCDGMLQKVASPRGALPPRMPTRKRKTTNGRRLEPTSFAKSDGKGALLVKTSPRPFFFFGAFGVDSFDSRPAGVKKS